MTLLHLTNIYCVSTLYHALCWRLATKTDIVSALGELGASWGKIT